MNRDPEQRFESTSQLLRFGFEQLIKGVYTAMPGHIQSYDASTRRASVQPALDILTTDGGAISAPVIPNVPVLWPSGHGWTFLAPLTAGDPVLLLWSQRGLTGFKRAHGRAMPDEDRLFDVSDAMALPGFGPLDVTPVSAVGPAIQANDGTSFVAIEPTGVRIATPGDVDFTVAGEMRVNGQRVHVAETGG